MTLLTRKPLAKLICSLFATGAVLFASNAFAIEPIVASASTVNATAAVATTEDSSSKDSRVLIAQNDPYQMVEKAASKTFARIKAEQINIKKDPEILRTIMEEELMPYIDYRFSSFKVLGKYTRSAEPIELQEFVTVFRQYLITSYAVAMGYYDNQVVEFEPAKDYDKRTDVTVRAIIKDENRPEIKVAFKVRKGRDGEWQAYDMIAEGISLISSKQSEFESILRKDGILKVIELMRDSIRKPIVLQSAKDEAAE